jgi:hypothetical protein
MNFASRNLLPSCPCVDVFCPIVQVLPMVLVAIAERPESLSVPPAKGDDVLHAFMSHSDASSALKNR